MMDDKTFLDDSLFPEEDKIMEEKEAENPGYQQKNRELLRQYLETKDMDIRNQIVELNFPLVHSIVQGFVLTNPNLSYDDLFAEGCFGLMKAVDRYDLEKGKDISFSSIAYPYIKNEILTFLQENGRMISLPKEIQTRIKRIDNIRESLQSKLERNPTDQEIVLAYNEIQKELAKERLKRKLGRNPKPSEIEKELKYKTLDMNSLFSTLLYDSKVTSYDASPLNGGEEDTLRVCDSVADTTQDPVEEFETKNITESLSDVMNLVLDEQEKDILLSRNRDHGANATLAELAEKYHLSKERIRQIENQAKEKVRKAYQKGN